MRRLARRLPLIFGMVVAAVLTACSSDDSGSKKKSSSATTGAAATADTTASTAASDPAACMRGSFRFTRMDYDGPVQTAFAPTTIVGGIAGRRIELKPDNTFHFTDHGREQVQFSLQRQGGSVPGTAVLKAQADGIYVPTATTSTFDITALQGSLTLTFYDGSTTNIALPPATGTRSRFASRLFRGFH
jgi:hypothetical protein